LLRKRGFQSFKIKRRTPIIDKKLYLLFVKFHHISIQVTMTKLFAVALAMAFTLSCKNNHALKTTPTLDSSPTKDTVKRRATTSTISEASTPRKETVIIGNKEWTVKNLDVIRYRNGDTILQITDASKWAGSTKGAWCYYDNDSANGAIYGKLYNWYAVHNPRGLAPIGLHVPSDAEWTALTNSLGGESVAGNKMKSPSAWHRNLGVTNESGFTGLPGGYRLNDGRFATLGTFANWWSSTKATKPGTAWDRILYAGTGEVLRGDDSKNFGLSIRCIRDR
jgi:uncharacterized protein (TIGR02145 family)